MLSLIGFLMVIGIIVILLKGKWSPIVALISIPIIAGLLAGYGITELSEMVKAGVATVTSNTFLFIFFHHILLSYVRCRCI